MLKIKAARSLSNFKAFDNNLQIQELQAKLAYNNQQLNRNEQMMMQLKRSYQLLEQQFSKQKKSKALTLKENQSLRSKMKKLTSNLQHQTLANFALQKLQTQKNEVLLKNFKKNNQSPNKQINLLARYHNQIELKLLKIGKLSQVVQSKNQAINDLQNRLTSSQQQLQKIKQLKIKLKEQNKLLNAKLANLSHLLQKAKNQNNKLKETQHRVQSNVTVQGNQTLSKKIQQQNKTLLKTVNQFTNKNNILIKNNEQLKLRIQLLQNKLQDQRTSSENIINQLQNEISNINLCTVKLQQLLQEKEKVLSSFLQEKSRLQANVQSNSKEVLNHFSNLNKLLKCELCKKLLNKPVTIIPCGHSFCFNCKSGYFNNCKSCGPLVKLDVVYRNQVLQQQTKLNVRMQQLFNNLLKFWS